MDALFTPHLEVIVGCMSSGKTEELIRRLDRARFASLKTKIFKPKKDTRSGEKIASRNGLAKEAIEVLDSIELEKMVEDDDVVVGIDEVQFFDEGIVPVVMRLVRTGRRVIISGLDLDYREEPFVVVSRLMALAYPVTKLTAICLRCKNRPATRSQRIVQSDERELVGDKEYEPRCLTCYEPVT